MRLDPIRLLWGQTRPGPGILSKARLSSAFFQRCFLSQQFRSGILCSWAQTRHLDKLTKTIHSLLSLSHHFTFFTNSIQAYEMEIGKYLIFIELVFNQLVLLCLNLAEAPMQQKPEEALIVFNISFTKGKVRITEHTDCVISEVYTNNFQLQKQTSNLY